MDCGSAIVKYILFLFNLLCAICGILLIIFGSLVLADVSDINATDYSTSSIPIATIVLGSIVFLIAFLGCCGACKENNCMTMTYSILLLLLLVGQIVLVVYTWADQSEFLEGMKKVIDEVWQKHETEPKLMDPIQIGFQCCGNTGPHDWPYTQPLPTSCCGKSATTCSLTDSTVYTRGCKDAFVDFWQMNINLVKYVGLGIALIEFVGVVFACCLSNSIRNSRRRGTY